MQKLTDLSESQVLSAIQYGEFGPDVINSDRNVAVIMTQDWCTQWAEMKGWIYSVTDKSECACYLLKYDQSVHFKEFLKLKEDTWMNSQIPYIRYYKDGQLVAESNYVSEDKFVDLLKRS